MKNVINYVPEAVDLDGILSKNPPSFPYKKDKFVHIMHIVSAIPIYNEGFQNCDYVPINQKILQSRIKDGKKHLEYLVATKILECDSTYIPGQKSKGYKFTSTASSNVIPVEIT